LVLDFPPVVRAVHEGEHTVLAASIRDAGFATFGLRLPRRQRAKEIRQPLPGRQRPDPDQHRRQPDTAIVRPTISV
jgi:hypothetical protein